VTASVRTGYLELNEGNNTLLHYFEFNVTITITHYSEK